jgi:hypothetical protein
MNISKEQRTSLRIGIKKITSIVKSSGSYKVEKGDDKTINTKVKILDISPGGLCIEAEFQIKVGITLDLEIPKIEKLNTNIIQCECTRSVFREDPLLNKSCHELGLKFKKPNTEYLKKLYELAITKKI